MFLQLSIFLFFVSFSLTGALKIHTPQGEVKGVYNSSYRGRKFESYYGIPYAKPPVGNLRFRSPVPYGKWKGIRDGSKEGSMCLQLGYLNRTIVGSEDCLYANVYTPSSVKPKQYPVLIWIHGGGFYFGSGNTLIYIPDYLLDRDIVLVTFNYRLGALGFASTENSAMPGNYGLKDQVLALKWVRENIAAYGGNPESVTIFGQSAGGASVHYHMMSPLSKGLFHRAIPMSGTTDSAWATNARGVNAERTKKLAALFGCPTDTSVEIVKCLRKLKPVEQFLNLTSFVVWETDPVVIFNPVVEPKGLKGAFLTHTPYSVNTSVPMMIGMTSKEGLIRTTTFHLTGGISYRISQINDHFEKIIPLTLVFDRTAKHPADVARRIRKFYFGNRPIDMHSFQRLTDMYTDSWFTSGIAHAVRKNSAPSYLYLFDYRGSHSLTERLLNSNKNVGACHTDDLIYIIPDVAYVPNCTHLSHKDKRMRERMLNLWTNFVIYGNPTHNIHNLQWEPTTGKELDYFHNTLDNPKMEKRFKSKEDKFWKHLPLRDKDYETENRNKKN